MGTSRLTTFARPSPPEPSTVLRRSDARMPDAIRATRRPISDRGLRDNRRPNALTPRIYSLAECSAFHPASLIQRKARDVASSIQPIRQAVDRARLNIRDVARAGKFYSLAVDRFPGMPLFPGHPPFQVLTYRSPQGIRVSGAQPWGPGNDAGLGYMCEYVLSTSHSGAHIDALAHMTIGADDHWFCGAARTHLGDFGPTAGDATAIPTIWTRGVLFDVPRHRGVDSLGRSEPVSADELKEIAKRQRRRTRARRCRPRANGLPVALAGHNRSGGPPRRRTGYLSSPMVRRVRRCCMRIGHRDVRSPARARRRIVGRPATRSPFTRCC